MKSSKTFKKLKCSPNRKKTLSLKNKAFTCFTDENLFLFKTVWNQNSNNKIKTNNSEEIWKFFKTTLKHKCYNELCWLNTKNINSIQNKELLVKQIFKPFAPDSWKSKPYEWLSSLDITKILKQYQDRYKNFKFIGPSPIDFDTKKLFSSCVWEELCNFNLKKYLSNNKTKIGIIFNTDPHYKSGTHWIALFIDLTKRFIYYFDSNGDKVPKQINRFIERVKRQGHELNIDFTVSNNVGFVHQFNDGQCGMYSIYFIVELVKETKNYNFFNTKRIKDSEMKNLRRKYYNYN